MGIIQLTQKKITLVDDADEDELRSAYRTFYAVNYHGYWYANGMLHSGKPMLIHRFLTKPPQGMIVDHLNGDGLDNRRINLRICTRAENSRNRQYKKETRGKSAYRGITWKADIELWEARVGFSGKRYSAGLHETEESAAKAYDWLATRLHGEYGNKNLPHVVPKAPYACCEHCPKE